MYNSKISNDILCDVVAFVFAFVEQGRDKTHLNITLISSVKYIRVKIQLVCYSKMYH